MNYQIFEKIPGLTVSYGASLKKLTSFHIGGCAEVLLEPHTPEAAIEVMRLLDGCDVPYAVLGNGSNTLVADEGFPGIVIHPVMDEKCRMFADRIRAGSGVLLSGLACFARDEGLEGLAFAGGIPGALGGALSMNAGAYEHRISEVVETVSVVLPGGLVRRLTAPECAFGYRESIFLHHPFLILEATLALKAGDKKTIAGQMKDYAARRTASQPLSLPSAGSTFKRPEGFFAGKLIQDAGLKGYRIGGAEVSTKHAGFIVNVADATAEDVCKLISHIQKTVYDRFGVSLEPEIRMLGFRDNIGNAEK